MSLVYAEPDVLDSAATELQSINAAVAAGHAAAATPTTGVIPAASDLVSLLTASQFATHAKLFQEIGAQTAAIHTQMATTLGLNAGSYAAAEASNAANIG
ncbi:PE family protein [Mycobacterium asiaticum]|uniref:PE family protein n=1 Tax=Mycobacterium asiaticum TaxID=1790 RepID=A0A1A3NI26_MYCAS|nr:PE family protein [Mycobacterium asiaticum]OBK20975.1 PE family protein [Mycobacterium asiaticum]